MSDYARIRLASRRIIIWTAPSDSDCRSQGAFQDRSSRFTTWIWTSVSKDRISLPSGNTSPSSNPSFRVLPLPIGTQEFSFLAFLILPFSICSVLSRFWRKIKKWEYHGNQHRIPRTSTSLPQQPRLLLPPQLLDPLPSITVVMITRCLGVSSLSAKSGQCLCRSSDESPNGCSILSDLFPSCSSKHIEIPDPWQL